MTPSVSPAAIEAMLVERPTVPAPVRARYPWNNGPAWSRTGLVHMAESGVDFHCSARQFCCVLTAWAGRHDLAVRQSRFSFEPEDGGPRRDVVVFRFDPKA